MLIVGDDFAVVYENVCDFTIENCSKAYGVFMGEIFAHMNNGDKVSLGAYENQEEAQNVIKAIGNASKTVNVYNL